MSTQNLNDFKQVKYMYENPEVFFHPVTLVILNGDNLP
jgi:hypothetical protein